MERWEEIYGFWFGEPGTPDHGAVREFWFRGGPDVDREIRRRFEADYEAAAANRCRGWYERPRSCMALIVLLDQFPRNMYRGEGRAFDADGLALEAARHAVFGPFHDGLLLVEKLFAYLPFEHSEALSDQETSVRLFSEMEEHGHRQEWLQFAEDHLDLIRRFGRFPHRNALLGRESTPEEIGWLSENDQRFGTDPSQQDSP